MPYQLRSTVSFYRLVIFLERGTSPLDLHFLFSLIETDMATEPGDDMYFCHMSVIRDRFRAVNVVALDRDHAGLSPSF